MNDVLLSAAAIYQLFASLMVLSAAAMVCSHCCQQTVSFLTISDFLFLFLGFRRAYLAVRACGARFRCHAHYLRIFGLCLGFLSLWDVVGGPTWLCITVVPDFGATCATSIL
jgi:hypothetical protein